MLLANCDFQCGICDYLDVLHDSFLKILRSERHWGSDFGTCKRTARKRAQSAPQHARKENKKHAKCAKRIITHCTPANATLRVAIGVKAGTAVLATATVRSATTKAVTAAIATSKTAAV